MNKWKLFTEKIDNDPEFESIKSQMLRLFNPFFLSDEMLRKAATLEAITEVTEKLLNVLITTFEKSLDDKINDEQMKSDLHEAFIKATNAGKQKMINHSFKQGVIDFLDSLLPSIKEIQERGEEWKKEKSEAEILPNASKDEINNLINDALDKKDFDRVKYLSQFIKESNKNSTYMEIYVEPIINYIINLINKYSI